MRYLLLFLALCGNAWGQNIKIGELNSYKVFAAFLEPYKKGMELALEEINAGGGVDGRKLELITLAGKSHAVSYLINAIGIQHEAFAPKFPTRERS